MYYPENLNVMERILQKIHEYDRIFLFRHKNPDGDCVGSTRGLKHIIEDSLENKQVLIVDEEAWNHTPYLGTDIKQVDPELYDGALGIVLDTATTDRISNPMYTRCRELIKIDHHINKHPYGDISWVEENRSSLCEMIVAFYYAFRDRLTLSQTAASCLYLGMITDSGRFRYEEVNGDTLRCAALLLDAGVDQKQIMTRIYSGAISYARFKSHVFGNMDVTKNGVLSVYIDLDTQQKYDLDFESACRCVSLLDDIRDCLCWIAFVENPKEKGSIRVRVRSRFVVSEPISCKYGGGGHAHASGTTISDHALVDDILRDADELVKNYKETHEGWL